MSTVGSTPAASACAAWARPISPPSIVTDEFNAMFCDLNGATRYPARAKRRQKAVARTDLPTADPVPWIMRHGANPFIPFPPATSAVACSNRRSTLIADLEARQGRDPRRREPEHLFVFLVQHVLQAGLPGDLPESDHVLEKDDREGEIELVVARVRHPRAIRAAEVAIDGLALDEQRPHRAQPVARVPDRDASRMSGPAEERLALRELVRPADPAVVRHLGPEEGVGPGRGPALRGAQDPHRLHAAPLPRPDVLRAVPAADAGG